VPTDFVFDANISCYLEADTYRSDGITFLVKQYEKGEGIWGATYFSYVGLQNVLDQVKEDKDIL
jgi:hypothetical protein